MLRSPQDAYDVVLRVPDFVYLQIYGEPKIVNNLRVYRGKIN
jgi:hypothetical protein